MSELEQLEMEKRILVEEVRRLHEKLQESERQAEDWQRRYLLEQSR